MTLLRCSIRLSVSTILKPSLPGPSHRCLSVEASLRPSLDPATENLRLRRQLALSYRLLDRLGFNEGACNHLTVMAPAKNGKGEVMLLAPGFLPSGASPHWSELTASSLIGVDTEARVVEEGSMGGTPEESAACIHIGVRKAKKDAKVLFHVHSPYVTAQGCLADPKILPVHQDSPRFMNKTAYYEEYGVPDVVEEGMNLGKKMADKDTLFMCNHGILYASPTVHLAFDSIYYLERAAMYQMLALAAAGGDVSKLKVMDKETHETSAAYYTSEVLDKYAIKHFYSWWNKYVRESPDVFE